MFSCKTIKLKAKLCIEVWLWKEVVRKTDIYVYIYCIYIVYLCIYVDICKKADYWQMQSETELSRADQNMIWWE